MKIRKKLGIFAVALAVSLGAAFAVSAPAEAHASGYYYFKIYGYNLCLNVRDASLDNGALLQVSGCVDANRNFQFYIHYKGTGNGYTISPQHSYKCLDVADFNPNYWAFIQQYDCLGWGQTNQVFFENNPDFYTPRGPVEKWVTWPGDICLQPGSLTDGANVTQLSCGNTTQSHWEMVPVPVHG